MQTPAAVRMKELTPENMLEIKKHKSLPSQFQPMFNKQGVSYTPPGCMEKEGDPSSKEPQRLKYDEDK